MKLKKFPIIIALSILSSLLVVLLYFMGFNVLSTPPKSAEELLELHLTEDNQTLSENDESGGLVSAILPPKLSYFQFMLSFSANLKDDKNIMNMEVALSTFKGEFYMARLKHHEPALRRVILDTLSETPEDEARTKLGKEELSEILLLEINLKLENLAEEPAIEGVHFTSFAIR
jgi:flagellar basal body-associated protein FliL